MNVVVERFVPFADVPLGGLFVFRERVYWKVHNHRGRALGTKDIYVRLFASSRIVCHIII